MGIETILIVDDTQQARALLDVQLRAWGFATVLAETGTQALRVLAENRVDLILSDLVMPDMDGMKILFHAQDRFPDIPFIMLTAHASIDKAVAALRLGATDFVEKPFVGEELLARIRKSLGYRQVTEENRKLKLQLGDQFSFQQIVSKSPGMTRALQMAEQVSAYPRTTVALHGESGVGKEVLARAIHFASGRPENRFVAVNCAGIPATLLESELFGHVRGAFTGADRDREGMFDLAREGTILLDEIGDMPLELQAKILRVIQEKSYAPLGSSRQVQADFRIIVATHHDLGLLVRQGRFRADLYHRINTFPISIPPLRERKEEIPLLVEHFVSHLRTELGKYLPGISKRGMDFLQGYDWPGNIRELKNSLERAAIVVDHELINPSHLSFLGGPRTGDRRQRPKTDGLIGGGEENFELQLTLKPGDFSLEAVINRVLEITLARCNNNKSLAAQILKTDRRIFYRSK
ncbi:sigma-54-dependent transcriptional regulator [Geomonas anaerohicana]|uniref:Sigma-54-dependent Fis family transcriptional regulator n=1 Tax=Geomonas anaerohicana TaxID=2798583 RepID=A0ABS0Y9Y3_9BACT|nr:sigma-54 dependent transcriptional regulator [Geomonas anaerohicana]MBJ6749128.1 sigma-54-dependent Fis family transcriptional regulator [Geomonas anaerohicana]